MEGIYVNIYCLDFCGREILVRGSLDDAKNVAQDLFLNSPSRRFSLPASIYDTYNNLVALSTFIDENKHLIWEDEYECFEKN